MKLPEAGDRAYQRFVERAENMHRSMQPDRWTPETYPALAMIRTGVKALAQRDRAECAALLRDIAEALEK